MPQTSLWQQLPSKGRLVVAPMRDLKIFSSFVSVMQSPRTSAAPERSRRATTRNIAHLR
jgi:hypothetical protein